MVSPVFPAAHLYWRAKSLTRTLPLRTLAYPPTSPNVYGPQWKAIVAA
jgi:hypothetical protein